MGLQYRQLVAEWGSFPSEPLRGTARRVHTSGRVVTHSESESATEGSSMSLF